MKSLDDHSVYREQKGCVIDDGGERTPDVTSLGLEKLRGGPLDDYNTNFVRLQKRRRMKTVSDMKKTHDKERDAPQSDKSIHDFTATPFNYSSPSPVSNEAEAMDTTQDDVSEDEFELTETAQLIEEAIFGEGGQI